MSGTHTNPRRRALKATDSHPAPLRRHAMSLRKSGTFNAKTSLQTDMCDLDNLPFMPRRSPTSTEHLEALVNDPNPNIQRVADLLKDLDRQMAGHKSQFSDSLHGREVDPLPSFLLRHTSMAPKEEDCKPMVVEQNPHEHASDSGLGSSLSASMIDDHRSGSTNITTPSAITSSISSCTGAQDKRHVLSDYARQEIKEGILDPLIAEESLKDFHPLINEILPKILTKTINNLRDLEKTLIFLAPNYSATATSYQQFCERSIQLMVTTVERLPEQDQRLPTDRAYTNHYFLDLTEQIRRMAAIMAATKEKEANGQELDEMDYTRDEKIMLRGGIGSTGRPAEFVREKADGRVIPLADSSSKRPLPEDEMELDEEAIRSMARRRKSEKPGDVMHACRDCKKEFKRPCDLTKHEKTHSRPWKCADKSCRFHIQGWPTEKERDRHWNDKHSNAPAAHRCLFFGDGCTYTSKRESNCKQHMEKAHGWQYIRSKSNGRKRSQPSKGPEQQMPPTPPTPFSAASAFATPQTPFLASPSVPVAHDFGTYAFGTPAMSAQNFQDDFRRDSLTTTEGSVFTYSSGPSPIEGSSFENAVTPDDLAFNHSDMLNCGVNMNFSAGYQQHTPAMSTGYETMNDMAFSLNTTMPTTMSGAMPHLSPGAQDPVLYTPDMHMDEGFNEPLFNQSSGDFQLYNDATMSNGMDFPAGGDFFEDLNTMGDFNQVGGQFDNQMNSHTNNTSLFGDQAMIGNLIDDFLAPNMSQDMPQQ